MLGGFFLKTVACGKWEQAGWEMRMVTLHLSVEDRRSKKENLEFWGRSLFWLKGHQPHPEECYDLNSCTWQENTSRVRQKWGHVRCGSRRQGDSLTWGFMFSRGHGAAKVTAVDGLGDEGLSVRLTSNLFQSEWSKLEVYTKRWSMSQAELWSQRIPYCCLPQRHTVNPQHSVIIQSVRYKELCRLALQEFFFHGKEYFRDWENDSVGKMLAFQAWRPGSYTRTQRY